MRRRLALVALAMVAAVGGALLAVSLPPAGGAAPASRPAAADVRPGPPATTAGESPTAPGGSPAAGSPATGSPTASVAPAAPPVPAAPSPSPNADPSAAAAPRVGAIRTERLDGQLQRALDELRRRAGIPGISATIIFRDGSSWSGVSGLADVRAGIPVSPKTAFAVASISKTFLAALILELSAEGRFGLNDSVRTYLPDLKVDHSITIRMLLDHTSGLNDFFFHPKIDRALLAERALAWTPAHSLGYVGKPYFPPGTGWHYSNTNYLVLGLLAERVGRASLADQMRTRFFDPLELRSAFYQMAEKPRGPLAHGYRFAGARRTLPPIDLADGTGVVPFRSVVSAAAGAGSVAASAGDIARWARALYGGRVLDDPSLALMLGDVEIVSPYRPRVPYGLGVQALTINGFRTLGHSGRLLGFRAAVRYLPDEAVSIAVLTNQSRADPAAIVRELLRIALPPAGPCGDCAAPS